MTGYAIQMVVKDGVLGVDGRDELRIGRDREGERRWGGSLSEVRCERKRERERGGIGWEGWRDGGLEGWRAGGGLVEVEERLQ